MAKSNESTNENQTELWGDEKDLLSEAIRRDVGEKVELILREELDAYLGAGAYERVAERVGYRHGSKERAISTAVDRMELTVPRARIPDGKGGTTEWQSHILPRYARRAKAVDRALIGMYLGGVNTRRVKAVLRPLLRGTPLSKSSISRLVGRLKLAFEAWRKKSLEDLRIRYVYLDAIFVKCRFAGRVSSLPILAAVGVNVQGEKILVALEARGSESADAWRSLVEDLSARGVKPVLAIIDGNAGLRSAVEQAWRGIAVQRCAVHKLRNLLEHAPRHAFDEIRDGFHAIVYAKNETTAQESYDAFVRKWRKQGAAVAASLQEAGAELMTFYRFPESQWKGLRTTNVIERLNLEFRRRIKTQASFPTTEAAVMLMFGLVATGLVKMRRLDGWQDLKIPFAPEPEPTTIRTEKDNYLLAA